ncbi:hypothetical protein [Arenibaculum pallidiluteum]|uniref:hypothetical protein n=1 Tax=Arenibaculum pallidiluteum TaxID=2812559 RepID=UPI001A97CAAD|nr:hypothetical protein [Arenibaculum pallidiluteum]
MKKAVAAMIRPDPARAVEETTLRAIRDLEMLARSCPQVRAYEIQHTLTLLRASLPR